jgi:hypothetical protein
VRAGAQGVELLKIGAQKGEHGVMNERETSALADALRAVTLFMLCSVIVVWSVGAWNVGTWLGHVRAGLSIPIRQNTPTGHGIARTRHSPDTA